MVAKEATGGTPFLKSKRQEGKKVTMVMSEW